MSEELKPFQKVLVRDFDHNEWKINFFEQKCADYFLCLVGHWKQCIPYNNKTAHLLGTTDSPTPPEPEFRWGDKVEVMNENTWEQGLIVGCYAASFEVLIRSSGLKWNFSKSCIRHADW